MIDIKLIRENKQEEVLKLEKYLKDNIWHYII